MQVNFVSYYYIVIFILLKFIINMLYYIPSESLDRIFFFNIINFNV